MNPPTSETECVRNVKLRQPTLIDVRESLVERVMPGGKIQMVRRFYAHLMFGQKLVRVSISEHAAAWTSNNEPS
jgi:hypothetical protein